MRVFFIGSVLFSRKMFETLFGQENIEIVGIATKSSSQFNADHSDISDIAIQKGIEYRYVRNINTTDNVEWIKSLKPEVIFCFGWSSLIKNELLDYPKYGVIGYHPAKLPQNRGRHPIIWALVLGLKETASTFFKMDYGIDSGPIVNQAIVKIEFKDDAQTLYNKLIVTAQNQLNYFLPKMIHQEICLETQKENISNVWRKREKKDGEIDFRMSTLSIYNLIRALAKPYVGAHLLYEGREVKIWKSKLGPIVAENFEPGKVLDTIDNKEILIKTGDGSIWFIEHEFKILPTINNYIL